MLTGGADYKNGAVYCGGGARGFFQLRCLLEIARQTGQYNVHEFFKDIMAVSVGALNATGLCYEPVDQFYDRFGQRCMRIFEENRYHKLKRKFNLTKDIPLYFNSLRMLEVLNDCLPEKVKLSELPYNLSIVACDLSHNPVIFSRDEALKNPDKDFYASDLVIISAAAPAYFKDHTVTSVNGRNAIRGVDGGLSANFPSVYLLDLMQKKYGSTKAIRMFVFENGTDYTKPPMHMNGFTNTIKNLSDYFLSSQMHQSDLTMRMILGQENYFRYAPNYGEVPQIVKPLTTRVSISLAENIKKMYQIAEVLIEQPLVKAEIYRMCEALTASDRPTLEAAPKVMNGIQVENEVPQPIIHEVPFGAPVKAYA